MRIVNHNGYVHVLFRKIGECPLRYPSANHPMAASSKDMQLTRLTTWSWPADKT